MIDAKQAYAFIEALAGDADAPCTFQTFDDKGVRPDLACILHGSLTNRIGSLNELQSEGAGVFVTINATDLKGRRSNNVVAIRAVFVDADNGEVDYGSLPPASIVVRSARGEHRYWLTTEGESLLDFVGAQSRLAAALGTDPKVKDLPRVMRLPGSIHRKGEPFRVELVEASKRCYTIDEVVRQLPEIKPAIAWVPPVFPLSPDRDSALAQALRYFERVDAAVEGSGGDHATFRAACLAAIDFDLSDDDALRVLGSWNQRCSPPWPKEDLAAKIKHARRYAQRAPGSKLRERRPAAVPRPRPAPPTTPVETVGPSLREVMKRAVFAAGRKSDVAVAERFILDITETHGGVRPVATRGALYAYESSRGVWRELSRDTAESLVQAYDGNAVESITAKGEVINRPLELSSSRCEGIAKCAIRYDDIRDPLFFDQTTPGIVFANGVVTVSAEGLKFVAKSPDHRALAALPFDYVPDAACPEWQRVLQRVFAPDIADAADKRALLQEFVGACMAGIAYQFTKCLVLSGAGNNGKNVISDLVSRHLFPADTVTRVPPHQFGKGEYVAQLRSSRLNVASELPAHEIGASEMFKAVIDGNEITARSLYKDPFPIRPLAGHLFLANELPGTRDHTDGYWRRFLVLGFNRNFDSDPDETGRTRRKDEILAILCDELPGIALWALQGAARLLCQARYTLPQSHADELREWRLSTDPVASFVDQCCASDDDGTQLSEIYRALCDRFDATGHKRISTERLASRLKSLGIKRIGKTKRGARYALKIADSANWNNSREESWLRLVK